MHASMASGCMQHLLYRVSTPDYQSVAVTLPARYHVGEGGLEGQHELLAVAQVLRDLLCNLLHLRGARGARPVVAVQGRERLVRRRLPHERETCENVTTYDSIA